MGGHKKEREAEFIFLGNIDKKQKKNKLLPDINTFEYVIPKMLMMLDRDIIVKYQEQLLIKVGL